MAITLDSISTYVDGLKAHLSAIEAEVAKGASAAKDTVETHLKAFIAQAKVLEQSALTKVEAVGTEVEQTAEDAVTGVKAWAVRSWGYVKSYFAHQTLVVGAGVAVAQNFGLISKVTGAAISVGQWVAKLFA